MPTVSGPMPRWLRGPMFQIKVCSSSSGTQAVQLFLIGITPGAFIVQKGSR